MHETGGGRNIILKGGGLGGPEDVATTAVRILGRRLGQPGELGGVRGHGSTIRDIQGLDSSWRPNVNTRDGLAWIS